MMGSRNRAVPAAVLWLDVPVPGVISGVNTVLAELAFKDKAASDNYLTLVDDYAARVGQVRAKLEGEAGRLSGGEVFLSARLVADTGMNALGWPIT